MTQRLFYIYILSLPFVSAFAFTETITITVLTGVCLACWYTITFPFPKSASSLPLPKGVLLIMGLFLSSLCLSFFFFGLGSGKALNHLIAYLTTFLIFFVIPLYTMNRWPVSLPLPRITGLISFVVLAACLFTLVEAFFINVLNININAYIPRPAGEYYEATALGSILRIRGFAPESGHHSLMVEILGPILVYHYFGQKRGGVLRWIYVLILISSIVLSYSTAGFLGIGISACIMILLNLRKTVSYMVRIFFRFRTALTLSIVIPALIYLEAKASVFFSIYLSVISKLDSNSQRDREQKFTEAMQVFQSSDFYHQLLGYGPSGFRTAGLQDAIISFYPTVLFESGIMGLLFLGSFILLILLYTVRIQGAIRNYLLFGILSGLIHYFFVGDYWYPWLWFTFALTVHCYQREKQYEPQQSTISPQVSV